MNKQLALVSHFKMSEASRGGVNIEGWANKAVVDRGGDIINKEAWNLDNFHKNAMILYNHDRDKPIGKAIKVEPRDEGLYIKARISGSSDPEITKIRDLIREGILNTFSVGFDCKREEKSEGGVNEIKEAELFEVSVVTLPMNQDSTFTVSKKLEDVKTMALDYAKKMEDEEMPKESADIIEGEIVEDTPAESEEDMPVEDDKKEIDEETQAALDAFNADVEATMTGEGNPAAWVGDEELWAKAKEVSQAAFGETNYGFVTWYYLTHGGTKKAMEAEEPKEEPKEDTEPKEKGILETTPPVIDENPYLEQARQSNILLGTLIMEVQKLAASMRGEAIAKPEPKVEVEVTTEESETPDEETTSEESEKVAKLLSRAKKLFEDTNGKLKSLGL